MSATHILGISAFYHDSAACLLRTARSSPPRRRSASPGRRATRPSRASAVAFCLQQAGITSTDLAFVGFYDKPLLKFERILETYLGVAPRGFRLLPHGRAALDQGEALHRSAAPRGAAGYDGRRALRRAPRVPRGERVLPVSIRGGRHPDHGRRRRVGDRLDRRRPRQRPASSSRRCTGPTRWACSTPRSPTTRASRSTPASTRSWASPPTASRSTWT